MQKPLNLQEHTGAFVKFLLFFVVTTALLVAAIYFNYETPYQENRLLKDQVERNQVESLMEEKIAVNLGDARVLIDSLAEAGANKVLLEGRINNRLTKLNELLTLQVGDSNVVGKLNKEIIIVTSKYLEVKSKYLEMGEAVRNIERLEAEKIALKGDLDRLTSESDNLRRRWR